MSNHYFKFKQFTVWQDRCAMKVGTDGVLLGAWVPMEGCRRLLDIGTGTGLIALLLAQRAPQAEITAVEIDEAAAGQAAENVAASPWQERVKIVCENFRTFAPGQAFDLIVSNPPYFVDALKCPDEQRSLARHTGDLNYELLFGGARRLLTEDGGIAVIVPAELGKLVTDTAWNYGFHPTYRTEVYTKPGKPCRRLLIRFGRQYAPCTEDKLYIESSAGGYSPEFAALVRDFYLDK